MQIKKAQIFNYGKWHQVTFPFNSKLNVIYGKNEAGKTTLMSFIRGVLFGYLQRRSSHKNYILKGAKNYGGQLEIEANHHDYIVQRMAGKHGGDLIIMDPQGKSLDNTILKTIVGPFDRNTFNSLYYFGTVDLRAVTKLKRRDLIYRIQRIGMAHSNDWIDYQGKLTKQAKALFSPRGYKPPLNQKLKQYAKLMAQIKDAASKYDDYQTLLGQNQCLKRDQATVNKKMKVANSQLNRLRHNQTAWLQYYKLQELRPVMNKSIQSGFATEDVQQLQQLTRRYTQLTDKMNLNRQQLDMTQRKLVQDDRIQLYQQHRQQILTLMKRIDNVNDLAQSLKMLKGRQMDLTKRAKKLNGQKALKSTGQDHDLTRMIKDKQLKIDHQLPIIDRKIKKLQTWLANQSNATFDKDEASLLIRIVLMALNVVTNMWLLSAVQGNLNQWHQIKHKLTMLNQRINRIDVGVESYFKKWSFLKPQINLGSDDVIQVGQVKNFVNQTTQIIKSNHQANVMIKKIKSSLNSVKKDRNALKIKIQHFYQHRHVHDQEEFDEQRQRQQILIQQQQTYRKLSTQIGEPKLTALKQYATLDDVKKAVTHQTQQFDQLEAKNQTLTQKLTAVQTKLKYLVHNGSYDELQQRAANARTEINRLSARWLELTLASQWIDSTLNLATKGRVPKIEKQAQDNFKILTQGRYLSIIFNKTQIKVMRSDRRRFTLYELSKGTIQQLYLALIFAMAQVFGADYPMPVLIDDGFTDFDVDRRRSALKLLNSISQNLQVIYCTSDVSLADQATLNLDQD